MITYPVRVFPWLRGEVLVTTPSQGQALVKAGLGMGSCDMHWRVVVRTFQKTRPRKDQWADLRPGRGWRDEKDSDFVPAWSIRRLMEIAGKDVLAEGTEAGVDVSTPEKLRAYLVGYILIALSEGLVKPQYI